MDRWAHYVAEGDADWLALLYADDARLFPPNAPLLNGRSEAQSFFEIVNSVGSFDLSASVGSVASNGPLGYAWGTDELAFTPHPEIANAQATEDRGKYVSVLRQSWNTDLPVRTPMTVAE